jgi:hypothetical protein
MGAGAKLRRDLLDHGRKLAEHDVVREPEARYLAEIGMAVPLLARIARDQHAQIVRPAAAAGEFEAFGVGHGGRYDGHQVFRLRMILSEKRFPPGSSPGQAFSESCR